MIQVRWAQESVQVKREVVSKARQKYECHRPSLLSDLCNQYISRVIEECRKDVREETALIQPHLSDSSQRETGAELSQRHKHQIEESWVIGHRDINHPIHSCHHVQHLLHVDVWSDHCTREEVTYK